MGDNMSFADIIKNSVLEEFSGDLTFERVLISLLVSFAVALFIIWVYRLTFRGVVFNKSFAFSLILTSLITTSIIMTVTSNLALSLGMVGALSIVRFRTAVKDPVDTVFMFWAVCVGIMTGAGLWFWAVFANVLMGILYTLVSFVGVNFVSLPYLITVRYTQEAQQAVKQTLKELPKYRIRAKTASKSGYEMTVEAKLSEKDTDITDRLRQQTGVIDVSVVSYKNV